MNAISNNENTKKKIVVVLRGPSACIFKPDEYLILKGLNSSIGPVNITYKTHWITKDDECRIPGNLLIGISGQADNVENALIPFANAGLQPISMIALSCNAAIGIPEIEVSYDATTGAKERDYFQNYIPPESEDLYNLRLINVDATLKLISSVSKNLDFKRIFRSIEQYNLALNSWRLGNEILILSHLWMAVEALTKAKIRSMCNELGLEVNDQKGLADKLGIPIENLDPIIREKYLLHGDNEVYQEAKNASDGLEHGFMEYPKIQKSAQKTRTRLANYIRLSILEICGLDESEFSVLTKKPFDEPIGYYPIAYYIRGKLSGERNVLAAKDNLYPYMKWNIEIESTHFDEKGDFQVKPNINCTAELAEGISFSDINIEIWRPA